MKLLGNFTANGFLDCSCDGVYSVKDEFALFFKYTRSVKFNYFYLDYSSSCDMEGELFYAFNGDVCSQKFRLSAKEKSVSFYIDGSAKGNIGVEPYKMTLVPIDTELAELSIDAVAVDLRT